MDAVKAGIRARGDKVQLYTHAQLVTQSNAMIDPWLVAQAKRQIAERNSQVMSKGEKLAVQGLLLNETHAQNGAAK
jgi:biotin synthase-related radical SAM superfamily protein